MFRNFSKKNYAIVTTRPKLILATALIITILSGVLASGLSMELNWVALAPKGNESVKEYQQIIEDFPSLGNIIAIAESDDIVQMQQAVNDLENEVSKLSEYVVSVTAGLDQDFALNYGLLMATKEEAEMMAYMFADPNYDSLLGAVGQLLESSAEQGLELTPEELNYEKNAIKALNELINLTNDYVKGQANKALLEQTLKDLITGGSLITSENGKMAMVTIQPSFDIMDLKYLEPGVNAVEETVKRINDRYPDVTVRATGIHVVARDEMASISSDSYLTTLIAVGLILGILYFAFRAFSAPVLTFIPLILGIIWDIGLTMLLIGRLNMMTAFAAAMLVGLGIDYSIHMYSSYTERRSKGFDKLVALEHAISISGPGIITGALTTAAAFLALNISQLEMLRELGTVMGFGIICTLLSVFWVLPAIIVLKKEKEVKVQKIRGHYKWIGNIATVIRKGKIAVIVILILSTGFMAYMAKDIEFNMNLMELEPAGLASIELMEYMIDEYDMSADSFSVEVNNLEEVYQLHEAYEKVDHVKEVTSIASFIPKETIQIEKLSEIEKMKTMIPNNLPKRDLDPQMMLELTKYGQQGLDAYKASFKNLLDKTPSLIALETSLEQLSNSLQEASLMDLDQLSIDYFDIANKLSNQMLSVDLLTAENLPDNYKKQFVSEDGKKYLISVYPDFDIWSNIKSDMGDQFFDDIAKVNKGITGTPIFMKVLYESASEELIKIGLILVSILLLILLIHFRSIKFAILGFIPLALTLVFTVGTMVLFGLSFNMLNFLSLLLIIGIGVDYGVHILHHYKEGEKKIHYLFSSVGRAILLTSLTTMSGFGSLMFSSYRGVASLGLVLFIGVGYAFLMTIIVLPLLLKEE